MIDYKGATLELLLDELEANGNLIDSCVGENEARDCRDEIETLKHEILRRFQKKKKEPMCKIKDNKVTVRSVIFHAFQMGFHAGWKAPNGSSLDYIITKNAEYTKEILG